LFYIDISTTWNAVKPWVLLNENQLCNHCAIRPSCCCQGQSTSFN